MPTIDIIRSRLLVPTGKRLKFGGVANTYLTSDAFNPIEAVVSGAMVFSVVATGIQFGADARAQFFNAEGNETLTLSGVGSAVNYANVKASATGNPVQFRALGDDTDIDLQLKPKGSGVVRFGSHSAIAAETVTGYITVKDDAGTTRKLAVVS